MDQEFVKHLRAALNHLYDPDYIRRSPLCAVFGLTGRFDAPVAMQRVLEEAISAFKPHTDESISGHRRRIYDLVVYRYVEQWSQQEVADQLGISIRQYKRDQQSALESLALQLGERFDLTPAGEKGAPADRLRGGHARAEAADSASALDDDALAWLEVPSAERSADVAEIVEVAGGLVRGLAAKYAVDLRLWLPPGLPVVAVHPIALRQLLLNVLSVAIRQATGGMLGAAVYDLGWNLRLTLRGKPGEARAVVISEDDRAALDIARDLARRCGIEVRTEVGEPGFTVHLSLPAIESIPVLAVDDSADTLKLLQRATTGTRYRLIGTRDSEQCLVLAEQQRVQLVILDLMLPLVDGWEVLARLRSYPATAGIPVIVCSVLPQEELALSLGASAFLRKPITQPALLAMLDAQAMSLVPTTHSRPG